jgi:hypothetical protein
MRAMSSRASLPTPLAIVAALLPLLSSLVFAQNATTTAAPAREGNIYDHIDHQPTRAQVDNAEAATGRRASETDTKVLDEIKALLEETDRQDKKADEDLNDANAKR